MRRIVMLLVGSVTLVLLSVAPAMAQQYPPAPTPAEGARAPGAVGPDLAITGSNLWLLWLGLAVLVAGTALVMASRRRAAVRARARGVTEAIA